MKTLIVEDDFTSRLFLQEILKGYGSSHIAVNGKEAIEAVRMALDANEPYDLICLDVMMPEMDGNDALKEIRSLEKSKGTSLPKPARIIMTTSVTEKEKVLEAINAQCDYYLIKPLQKKILIRELQRLKLI
ncbi:MAG: response regulator [Deltaproteobacteria bacterium]|nr:response regulator [Deltaproteobacteria bacterium]